MARRKTHTLLRAAQRMALANNDKRAKALGNPAALPRRLSLARCAAARETKAMTMPNA
jgi:hypothetical protein